MLARRKETCRAISLPTLAAVLFLSQAAAASAQLSVDRCVRLALDRSPASRVSAAETRAATEGVREARAAYWPQLVGKGQYGRSGGFDTTVTDGGSTALTASVQALLFDGGQRKAQLAAARARLRSAAAAERQRRADVALEVRIAYFAALAARDEYAAYTDAARRMGDDLSDLEAMQVHGLATRNDVLRARQAVETAWSAGRSAEASLDAALAELTILTGTEVTAAALTEPPMTSLDEPTEVAVEASPTLEDARAGAVAAHEDTETIRSERRGRVTLNADAGFVGIGPGTTFREHGGSQFLLGFSVPLFDGGATGARIARATASTNAAEENVRLARQNIDLNLLRTGVEARRARTELDVWTRQLPDAEEALQLMRARFVGGGDVRLLEIVDALNELVGTRLNIVHARLAYHLAVAERERILGRVPAL